MRWYAWLAVAVVLLGGLQVSGLLTAADLEDLATRGKRLTNRPADPITGVVDADPSVCAHEAGDIDLDVYSLARMIRSEEGRSNVATKTAVAFAACNQARLAGQSVTSLLTLGGSSPGYYADQNAGKGRYAATGQDPYEGDAAIAAIALGGYAADPTNGATNWDRPKLQDYLLAKGTSGYTKTADQIAAERQSSGLVLVNPPGTDPTEIRFWAHG